jgi:ATP adenylyltransferase
MEIWQQMAAVGEKARSTGQLHSIPNSFEIVSDQGIDFIVRYAPQLIDKIRESRSPKREFPFLPPEPELFVDTISPGYNLVLNKFNVLDVHGLLTTTEFIAQTDQLQLKDFKVVSQILTQTDGLIFYNGGEVAGASQPHRHFQLVPQDMGSGKLPVQDAIDRCHHHEHGRIFPFEHRLFWLPDCKPETLTDAWLKLEYAWQPYNLLITQKWMLVVPRKTESVGGMSVNSLGFAGALLAKNLQELELIKQTGPMSILHQVCFNAD